MSAYLRRVERLAVEALWGLAESEPIISQQHQLLAVHSPSIACPTANSLPYLNASTPLHPIILRQVENGHLSWRSGSPRSHFARRQGRHLYLRKCGRGSFPLPSRQWKPHDQDGQDDQCSPKVEYAHSQLIRYDCIRSPPRSEIRLTEPANPLALASHFCWGGSQMRYAFFLLSK